jgi:hypothetical protein
MTDAADRRMFAPLRREAPVSPQAKLMEILAAHAGGATAVRLAEELITSGLAVGTKTPVTKRVSEMLDDLEQAARVERIPDGRYRVTRSGR